MNIFPNSMSPQDLKLHDVKYMYNGNGHDVLGKMCANVEVVNITDNVSYE